MMPTSKAKPLLPRAQALALRWMARNGGELMKDRAGWATSGGLWRAASGTILALERKGFCICHSAELHRQPRARITRAGRNELKRYA
jgi:DNA-binding PadR family transcriptional regulator